MSTSASLSIAGRLREQRLGLGWTQAELGSRAGIPAISVRRFERTGGITLERLLALAAALGVDVQLQAGTGGGIMADPGAAHVRQRGVRHPRPAPGVQPPANAAAAPAAAAPATGSRSPHRSKRASVRAGSGASAVTVDAAAVAAARKRYRDAILITLRSIVFGPLTNYTAAAVTQNVMRARSIPDADQPAFVAALVAELNGLNAENSQAYSLGARDVELWAKTWRPDLGIVDAIL